MKRFLTALFLLILLLTICVVLLPTEAQAAEIVDSGTCGSNLTWTLDDTGTLIISGTGAMRNYKYPVTFIPWYENKEDIISVFIENGVTYIGDEAFMNCGSLTEVTISDSVTAIGSSAFYNCNKLENVTIGNSVASIERSAFAYCNSLTNVYVTDFGAWCEIYFEGTHDYYSTTIFPYSNPMYYAENFYLNGAKLPDSIEIPDGTTGIGRYAFYGFPGMTSITIPASVTYIGDDVFKYCYPEDVYITDASAWCSTSVGNEYANPTCNGARLHILDEKGNEVTEIILDDTVTGIHEYAFRGSSIESITIPESVTYIGKGAFYGCTSLKDVYISDLGAWCEIYFENGKSNPMYYAENFYLNGKRLSGEIEIPDGVTSIGQFAFSGYGSLTSITIPDSVTSIGEGVFSGCTGLTSITIPDSVTSISKLAFSSCSRLTSITISDSVTNIGNSAFEYCDSLKNIIIPDGVTSIEAYAFSYCRSLTSIAIPESVTSIGTSAFSQCNSLNTVYYTGDETSWANIDLRDSNTSLTSAVIYYHMCYVTFKNWNGALLGEKMFQQGKTITFDSVPGKTADNTYTYTFSGWDQPVCTGDMEVTAQYTATYIDYTVKFQNWDGSVLQTQAYHYGDPVTAPVNPTRPYDDTYYYVFTGWDASVSATCDGNKTYTAVYEAKARTAVATPTTPVVLDYTPTKVILEPTEGYEYSLNGINWQDSNAFIGLEADTLYTFYQRVKETEAMFASQISPVLNFKTAPKATCSVKPMVPIVADYTYNKIVLVSQPGYEYRLNNGAWTTNPTFTGLSANTTYTVYQRITETAEEFASDASRGVTVKTVAAPTGKTSASRYQQLRQYIHNNATSANGKLLQIVQYQSNANYSYGLTNQNEGITFSMTSEHKGSSGFDITTLFTLYPDSKNINVSCTVSYFSDGRVMDMAMDTISVNRSTYKASTQLTSSESGFRYITSSDFSNLATSSMGVLCAYWNAHILSNLRFDLEDLGFVSFVNNSPSVCDIPSGHHAGALVLRNQREAGCLIDGYTGDYYCSACGEKAQSGSAIPSVGEHVYENTCDKSCNICGEERRIMHTYSSGCDRNCDICNYFRTALTNHTFNTEGVCQMCGGLECIPGDMNGDEEINDTDAMYLLRYTLFPTRYPLNQDGDVNGDSQVNDADAMYLLRHTLFPDRYPLYPRKQN